MYEFNITLTGSFEDVKAKLLDVLMQEQLGVATQINVQETLKMKLDLDMPAYQILGACNPKLASQIIGADINAGALLPCNVIIREQAADEIVISFMDPEIVLGLSESDEVKKLATIAREKLQKVADKLSQM